jgi:hypothetical protein
VKKIKNYGVSQLDLLEKLIKLENPWFMVVDRNSGVC